MKFCAPAALSARRRRLCSSSNRERGDAGLKSDFLGSFIICNGAGTAGGSAADSAVGVADATTASCGRKVLPSPWDLGAGVAAGVRHLVGQGYGPIGYLGWPPGSPVGDDRRGGWVAANTELAILDPALQELPPAGMPAAAGAVQSLVARVGVGGAIVCASDTLALAAYQVMRDQGLRPGIDIGLMGFDDTDGAEALGLTSVHQPLAEIAPRLLSYLAAADSGSGPPAHGAVFQPVVIARQSTDRSGHLPSISTPAGNRTHDGDES